MPADALAIPGNSAVFDRPITDVAATLLLPTMLFNIVVGNQLWMVGPFLMGQMISWVVLAFAAVLAIAAFRGAAWVMFLIACVPMSKLVEALTGEPLATLAYLSILNSVFLLAGLVLATRYPELMYRQVRGFLALCLPFMVLQVAGAGSWTQALNTEYWMTEDDVGATKAVFETLFVPEDQLQYGVGQGRPAGLLHSNNVLSFIIIFAFALQFGRIRHPQLTWSDAIFVGTLVLAMAKIAVAAFLTMALWQLAFGSAIARRRTLRMLGLTLFGYALYAVFFPGLFALQTSAYKIMYSITVRLVDLLAVFQDLGEDQRNALLDALGESPRYDYVSDEDVGRLSGYAVLVRYWPLVLGATLICAPIFVIGLRRIAGVSARLSRTALMASIAVVLFLAAVPFYRAQLYWLFFGFAATPLAVVFRPDFVGRMVELGRGGPWGVLRPGADGK